MLTNDRTVWIYTPPAYDGAGEPYPLLVLFDGDVYTSFIPTPTICDNLIAASGILGYRVPPFSPYSGRTNGMAGNEQVVAFVVTGSGSAAGATPTTS